MQEKTSEVKTHAYMKPWPAWELLTTSGRYILVVDYKSQPGTGHTRNGRMTRKRSPVFQQAVLPEGQSRSRPSVRDFN